MTFWTKLFATSLGVYFYLCPPRVRWQMAKLLAWIWFDLLKFRRWTVLRNLQIAFPEWDKDKKYQVARASMVHLCFNFFEFLIMPMMNASYMKKRVQFHGLEFMEKALVKNRGVLLLSLHLGNGDVAINMLALKGFKMNVISKIFKNRFANEFWFGVRRRRGTKFIEPHGTKSAFEILKACKANEAVIFVTDQFMGKPFGIKTKFFGRDTGTAYGLALFALKTGAPVLPVYTYHDENLKTHVEFGPEIDTETILNKEEQNSQNRDLQIRRLTENYNETLEQIIRRYPEQWMWIHRRWKVWE